MEVRKMSDTDLIRIRADIEREMEKRGISFSVGDIGESLAIEFFNNTKGLPTLQAAPTGTKNIDALSRGGDRYSIKTRKKAKKTGTIYPDDDEPDKQLFEYILLVEIDNEYNLKSLYQLTWEQFKNLRSWDKRMNAWYLSCSGRVLGEAKVLKN